MDDQASSESVEEFIRQLAFLSSLGFPASRAGFGPGLGFGV